MLLLVLTDTGPLLKKLPQHERCVTRKHTSDQKNLYNFCFGHSLMLLPSQAHKEILEPGMMISVMKVTIAVTAPTSMTESSTSIENSGGKVNRWPIGD